MRATVTVTEHRKVGRRATMEDVEWPEYNGVLLLKESKGLLPSQISLLKLTGVVKGWTVSLINDVPSLTSDLSALTCLLWFD